MRRDRASFSMTAAPLTSMLQELIKWIIQKLDTTAVMIEHDEVNDGSGAGGIK